MRGARLGGPAAHVQKSLAAFGRDLSQAVTHLEPLVGLGGAPWISWTMSASSSKNSKGASSATGDDDGVDRSEVIRRHLSAGAGTPLYT